jgi:hypothetical protein
MSNGTVGQGQEKKRISSHVSSTDSPFLFGSGIL